MSAKNKLGQKRVCPSCDAKFYDLNNNPAICPKCGHSFDTNATSGKRKAAARKEIDEQDLLVTAANKAKLAASSDNPSDALDDVDVDVHADIEDVDEMDDVEGIAAINADGDDDLGSEDHTVEEDDIRSDYC